MNVRRVSALALSLCAVLSVATAGPAAAKAAISSSGPTFTAVAGSAKYLVYVRFPHGGFGHPALVQGTLLVRSASGVTRTLGPITNYTFDFTLSQSMLVYSDFSGDPSATKIGRWINLTTDHSGWFYPHNDAAAAPHGWFDLHGTPSINDDAPEVLYQHTIGAKTVRLGIPLRRTQFADLSVGPHDLVVSDAEDADSGVVAMKFSQPGKFRTLFPQHIGPNDGAGCSSVTATKVACAGGYGGIFHLMLFDLQTGKALIDDTATMKCPGTYPVVLQDNLAYIQYGCHHRLGYINTAGTTHFSKRSFYRNDLISALGGVAVETTKSHNHLILFKGRGHSQRVAGT